MPIYDYKCINGHVFEDVRGFDDKTVDCPKCQETANRIISSSKVNCANDDAEWIREAALVANRDGGPHCQEFIKNPTRANWKKWMKGEGIRIVEDGEFEAFDKEKGKREEERHERITKEVFLKHRARKRIELHG